MWPHRAASRRWQQAKEATSDGYKKIVGGALMVRSAEYLCTCVREAGTNEGRPSHLARPSDLCAQQLSSTIRGHAKFGPTLLTASHGQGLYIWLARQHPLEEAGGDLS